MILDANSVHRLFNGDQIGEQVWNAVIDGRRRLTAGGRHKSELLRAGLQPYWQELILAGRVIEHDFEICNAAEGAELASGLLRSDDPHIIALAKLSGTRVLFSSDENLATDFKDGSIIDQPRGKVIDARFINSKACARILNDQRIP